MEPVTLRTERLLLRPFAPGDAEAVRIACQDPQIPRYTLVPTPYTAEDARAWVEETAPGSWSDDTAYPFAVCLRDSGTLVASVGLVRMTPPGEQGRQAELGYWTVADHRRRGYTAEAGRAICRWAFEALGVERVEWIAEAGNHGSRAVARRIGFAMEGTARSRVVHRGTRRDAWCGSLLPSDWGLPQPTPYLPYEERPTEV